MTHQQIVATYSEATLRAIVADMAAASQWAARWNAAVRELQRRNRN